MPVAIFANAAVIFIVARDCFARDCIAINAASTGRHLSDIIIVRTERLSVCTIVWHTAVVYFPITTLALKCTFAADACVIGIFDVACIPVRTAVIEIVWFTAGFIIMRIGSAVDV